MNEAGLFVTKSADWAYEEEYRVFHYEGETVTLDNGNNFVKAGKIEDIDTKKWPLVLRDVPPAAVRSVICGYRCNPNTRKAIAEALSNPLLSHVQLNDARPHRQFFRMEQTRSE